LPAEPLRLWLKHRKPLEGSASRLGRAVYCGTQRCGN
jgi:hypothetical protein